MKRIISLVALGTLTACSAAGPIMRPARLCGRFMKTCILRGPTVF